MSVKSKTLLTCWLESRRSLFSSVSFRRLPPMDTSRRKLWVGQSIQDTSPIKTHTIAHPHHALSGQYSTCRYRYHRLTIAPRKIPGNGPVTDLSLIDVQCNGWSEGGVIGSAPAPLFATAAPGSTVTFNWTTWPDSHSGREHSHSTAYPFLTYLLFSTHYVHGQSPYWL